MQTTKRLSGVSLLEVLAAIFVVSIGLLGVLAVIPFGAFQVSKARDAEYASNMLANAAVEIEVRKMAESRGSNEKFAWFEPYGKTIEPAHIVYVIDEDAKTVMRGQDDLGYTTYDDKRPDFRNKDGEVVIQSSGKYTWFFTFLLESDKDKVPVDVLACYNRVPSDDRQVSIPSERFAPANGGGTFTLPNADHLELLTQTKYVFVTWGPSAQVAGGAWCKVVFVDKSNPAAPKIVVTGALPNRVRENRFIQVYIPSGVLYHKRLWGVPIK